MIVTFVEIIYIISSYFITFVQRYVNIMLLFTACLTEIMDVSCWYVSRPYHSQIMPVNSNFKYNINTDCQMGEMAI